MLTREDIEKYESKAREVMSAIDRSSVKVVLESEQDLSNLEQVITRALIQIDQEEAEG